MPTITPAEAREALADIDQVARQMKRTLSASPLGSNLILWGLVWIAGFLGTGLAPGRAGTVWAVLGLLGGGGSMALGLAQRRNPAVRSDQARKLGLQLLLFWLAVTAYAFALAFLLVHGPLDRMVAIVSTYMLGYVAMGIWLRSPILALVGLGVTCATFLGRALVPPELFLPWMALFGGGGLLVPGLYVRFRWR
jgi:uncharacterized membrane protein